MNAREFLVLASYSYVMLAFIIHLAGAPIEVVMVLCTMAILFMIQWSAREKGGSE